MVNYRLFSQFSELADAISNDVFKGDVPIEIRLHDSKPRGDWGLKWKSGKSKDLIYMDVPKWFVEDSANFDRGFIRFKTGVISQAQYLYKQFIETIREDIDEFVSRISEEIEALEVKHNVEIQIKRSKSKTLLFQVVASKKDSSVIEVLINIKMFTNREYHNRNWKAFISDLPEYVESQAKRLDRHLEVSKDGFEKITTKEEIEAEIYRIAESLGTFRGKRVVDLISRVKWFKSITTMGRCHRDGTIEINEVKLYIPLENVRSTIYHELAHLFEMNHSKKFYAILLNWMPNYEEMHKKESETFSIIVRWMKENGIKGYGISSDEAWDTEE